MRLHSTDRLQPGPAGPAAPAPDIDGTAVLAYDEALRNGMGPRAAMRHARDRAGITDQLERLAELEAEAEQTAALIAELADLKAAMATVRSAATKRTFGGSLAFEVASESAPSTMRAA